MKTFPKKAEWVAEHRNGDKCYYYPGTGWISAHDGLVTGFDLADVQTIPDDATHIQFVGGQAQYVRHGDATCVDIWYKGAWGASCTLQKLPGTVVRIKDGDVLPVMPTAAKAQCNWVTVSEDWPTVATRSIEVQFENGACSNGLVRDFNFGGVGAQLSVVRWRYAS